MFSSLKRKCKIIMRQRNEEKTLYIFDYFDIDSVYVMSSVKPSKHTRICHSFT